jgi:hypothetical protein
LTDKNPNVEQYSADLADRLLTFLLEAAVDSRSGFALRRSGARGSLPWSVLHGRLPQPLAAVRR